MGFPQGRDIEVTYPGNMGYPLTLKIKGSGTLNDPFTFVNTSLHNFTRSLGLMNMRQLQCFPDEFYAKFNGGIIVKIRNQTIFEFLNVPEEIKNQLQNEVNSNLADVQRCYKEG